MVVCVDNSHDQKKMRLGTLLVATLGASHSFRRKHSTRLGKMKVINYPIGSLQGIPLVLLAFPSCSLMHDQCIDYTFGIVAGVLLGLVGVFYQSICDHPPCWECGHHAHCCQQGVLDGTVHPPWSRDPGCRAHPPPWPKRRRALHKILLRGEHCKISPGNCSGT